MSTLMSLFSLLQFLTLMPLAILLWFYPADPTPPSNARFRRAVEWVTGVSLIIAFFSLMWQFMIVPLVIAGVSLVCRGTRSPRTGKTILAATVMLLDVAFFSWWGGILYELNTKLNKYPVVTLVDRLGHKDDAASLEDLQRIRRVTLVHQDGLNQVDQLNITTMENVSLSNVKSFEQSLLENALKTDVATNLPSYRSRSRSLHSLLEAHRNVERQFTNSTIGFGFSRMRVLSFRDWLLDLPDAPLLKLKYHDSQELATTSVDGVVSLKDDLQPWHQNNAVGFLGLQTFGAVDWNEDRNRPDLSRVVGFQEHAFRTQPSAPTVDRSGDQSWQIDSLLLVSLLKHDPAAVYRSENLPNLKELATAETRPLDQFEIEALEQLQAGEDLIVHGENGQVRMLGSLRAAVQCLECHQVARGTLLGAFTYRLSRPTRNQADSEELANVIRP